VEDKIDCIHRGDTEIAETESFLICPEKYSGQIKSPQCFGIAMAAGLGLLENRPLTDSPEKNTLTSRPLRLERVTASRDEWAVKKCFENLNYSLLAVIGGRDG
jgi:hypothetical protein